MTQRTKAVREKPNRAAFCFFSELQKCTDIGIRCYG
ncbi:hypothetical protein EDC39_1175 [Geothermobacter ehrlichii]|uniref:Uncharacterized protein n=1 Tax=Geothermobacter ehrlichii TaxID=213224 RepID=A0A5D3WJ98_9BACT|nr:hypothetical protein EDC39_1175 [Geothermobacter ehrlichii]